MIQEIEVNKWYIIKPDFTWEYWDDLEEPSLKDMQEIVGGWIEAIPDTYLGPHILRAYVNEEGIPLGLEDNTLAVQCLHWDIAHFVPKGTVLAYAKPSFSGVLNRTVRVYDEAMRLLGITQSWPPEEDFV